MSGEVPDSLNLFNVDQFVPIFVERFDNLRGQWDVLGANTFAVGVRFL